MLRRQSTASRSDLSRRKSTSSARSVHLEHINAALAQRDAHIAASQAFRRSQDRSGTDMSLLAPPSAALPGRSEASRPRISQTESSTYANGEIRRQQSIRFVGPCSTKTQPKDLQKAGYAPPDGERGSSPDLGSTCRDAVRNVPRLGVLQSTENLRPRMSSGDKKAETPISDLAGNYLSALAAADEYYTAEDDIASAPSSYRRLRRSQSMFSPGNSADTPLDSLPNVFYFNSSSPTRRRLPLSSTAPGIERSNTKKENKQPPRTSITPALRAPKSMSFLRSRSTRTETLRHRQENDELRTASGRLGGAAQPPRRLKSQPSMFFRSKNKRHDAEQVPMRKSLRSSSSNGAVSPVMTDDTPVASKPGSLRNKARKASRSLKSKILTLFNRSKSETGSTGLPEQHIESQKTHVSSIFDTLQSTPVAADRVGAGTLEEVSLSRVPSNVASIHTVPPHQIPKSRQGSLESLGSEKDKSDDKSRVTSWGSSNPTTVAGQQQAWVEWERQRLSVIKETGAHRPSPSVRRPGIEAPSAIPPAPIPPRPTYDTQRVYSALMKRYEASQVRRIADDQRRPSTELSDPFRTMSLRSISAESHQETGEQSVPTHMTIRHVISSNESLLPVATDPGGSRHRLCLSGPESARDLLLTDRGRKISFSETSSSYQAYPQAAPGDSRELSTPIRPVPRQGSSPPGSRVPPDDSPSRHLFRTGSAYRRTLRENMEAAQNSDRLNRGDEGTLVRARDNALSQRTRSLDSDRCDMTYSESAYSAHTEDDPLAISSARSIVEDFPKPPSMHKDSGVSTGPLVYRPTTHRASSSGSSIDWKTWLAANVSKLELQSSPARSERPLEVEYALPRMPKALGHGHIRESAQICEDDGDEDIAHGELLTHRPSLPTTPLAAVEKAQISPTPRSVHARTPPPSPAMEQSKQSPSRLRLESDTGAPPPKCLPPPIPPRSALRQLPSPSAEIIQSGRDAKAVGQSQPWTPQQKAAARRSQSLARIRSLNRMRATNTGSPHAPTPASVKLVKKSERSLAGPTTEPMSSSPGLTAAVERQFGSLSQCVKGGIDDKENVRSFGDDNDLHGVHGAGLIGSNVDPEVMGSKRMVDLFLSSRRRRMVSTDTSGAFV